jgi:hypothetical protein
MEAISPHAYLKKAIALANRAESCTAPRLENTTVGVGHLNGAQGLTTTRFKGNQAHSNIKLDADFIARSQAEDAEKPGKGLWKLAMTWLNEKFHALFAQKKAATGLHQKEATQGVGSGRGSRVEEAASNAASRHFIDTQVHDPEIRAELHALMRGVEKDVQQGTGGYQNLPPGSQAERQLARQVLHEWLG